MALKDTYINYIELSNGDKYPIGGHHKTGSWNGLTYTAATVGSNTSELAFTIPTGTTATTVAAGDHTHANYVSYDSVKTLKTDNTTAQTSSSSETITGSGTINLHKVSKTGDYNDLLNKPNVSESLVEKTYSELKTLRDNSQLVPGTWYKITDYSCTTTQSNTSSAGHQFDIIVKADAVNKLNENAYAAQHAGDTYFTNSDLEAWQLWYCLDNDTNRFVWADSTNGKGVIYRMIDEFNNDIPYDFKNILFTTSGKYTNAYTFSYTENSTIKDASLLGWSKLCYSNISKNYIISLINRQYLNFNIFYSNNTSFACYSNTFGVDCYNNTFGNNCNYNTFGTSGSNNTFGNSCSNNTFGNNCSSNTLGNGCSNNKFGNYCRSNIFKTYCNVNTFLNNCYSNTFEGSCSHNTFGNNCHNNKFGGNTCFGNTFGNNCYLNTVGNNCNYNTFGNDCNNNKFGDSSSTINYCKHIVIDNGCRFLYINSTDTSESISNQLQNVNIHLGVQGTSSAYKTITIPDRNLQYESNVYLDESGNIKIVINEGEGSSYTAGIGISIASNTISNTGVAYLTTAPSSANTSGDLKFVVLDSEPATRYDGYIYIITESATNGGSN